VTQEIVHSSLPKYYDEQIRKIRELVNETAVEPVSKIAFKRYIWILMVDNYAKTKYAAEQTGKKEFASTTDSLSILAFPTENLVLQKELVQPPADRKQTCTPLNNLNSVQQIISTGSLKLGNLLSSSDKKGKSANFAHLSDAFSLASLPVKSSSHEQMLQVLKMLVNYFFESGYESREESSHECANILILPVLSDPEFVLEGIPFTVLFPDLFKFVVFGIPPFHVQKHCMESLSQQIIFLRVFKTTLSKAINFKPSVHGSLANEIDAMVSDLMDAKQ
jgi:hypothetical protein